jgi:hypothetical protein
MNSNNLFLDNKYTSRYYLIIENAKVRFWDGYTETHHIIPRCLGGSDDKTNLIELNGHEHLVCHLLLRKMLPEGQNNGVIAAAWRMVNMEDENGNRHKVTGRVYAKLKEEFAKAHSVTMKGRTPWNKGYKETRPEVLKNIQKAALARPEQSKESRELQASKTRGQKRTDEQRANLSRGQTGIKKGPMKQEHRDKRSKKLKGIKKADSVVENMKKRVQERLAEGSHPTKIRVSCIKTRKEYSLTTFMRYVVNSKPGPRTKIK